MTTKTKRGATPGWVIDDGLVSMEDQAEMLKADIGTEREWVAIGIEDEDGFAEVVALAHPVNARLIASAPKLLKSAKEALNALANLENHPNWSDEIEGRITRNLEIAIKAAEGGERA